MFFNGMFGLEPFSKQLAIGNVPDAVEYVSACSAGAFDLSTLFPALSNLSIDSNVVSQMFAKYS